MSINGTERQVYRISEVQRAMGWAHSTAYRLVAQGKIALVDTPIGKRITAAEFERLRGGKPLHLVHEPDPRRQAMAAHARDAKAAAKAETAKVAATADQLTVFMDDVRSALRRIEAAVAQGAEDQAVGPGKTPLQEIEQRPLRRRRKSTSGAAKKVIDGPP